MHLDAARARVEERAMLERAQIEVRVHVAIEAREDVEVELRGHARGVVVGGIERGRALAAIDAKHQRTTLADGTSHAAEEDGGLHWVEVADGRAGKERDSA